MTSTALPALSDLPDGGAIPGVIRIENFDKDATKEIVFDMTRAVYPHDQIYGQFCPINAYVAAPPREVYEYLADTRSLEEWTYSLRGFLETDEPGLWESFDRVGGQTKCYTRTIANPDAMTVDYHCAWDQGKHLWMIYLMRVVDAQVVLNKPGSVVTWVNCKHPFYDENPIRNRSPRRPVWVGDGWDLFYAGHRMEMNTLQAICEYRAIQGLPIKPDWMN